MKIVEKQKILYVTTTVHLPRNAVGLEKNPLFLPAASLQLVAIPAVRNASFPIVWQKILISTWS